MPITRPSLTGSLFPQLPDRSRSRFRVALIVLVAALAGFALLRWQAAMIATAVCGLPVLFVIYLRQTGIRRTVGVRGVVVSAFLGLGLGVGWALIAGPIVARAYDAALGAQTNVAQVLLFGVAVPISEALLMLVPAVVVRLMDRTPRDALDGFTIGALGATVFTGAATATLLVPQLAMGVTAPDRSVGSLLVEALVEGIAWPLVGLAAGGIVGIALWFTKPPNTPRRYRGIGPAALLTVLIMVTAMGVVDVVPLSSAWYGVLHLLIAFAVMAGWCRPSSRPRCVTRPTTVRGDGNRLRARSQLYRCAGVLAAGLAVAVAAGVVVSVQITPAPQTYVCPPDCGRPPLGIPVETNPRFSGDNGAFSVAYPGDGSAYEVTFDPPGVKGVELNYIGGDTGTLTLFGEPADSRTAKQIVQQLAESRYPGAAVDYEIPNASVGYQPGYGVVADVFPTGSSATLHTASGDGHGRGQA